MTHREPFGAPFLILPLFRFNFELAEQKQGASSRHGDPLGATKSAAGQALSLRAEPHASFKRRTLENGLFPSSRETSIALNLRSLDRMHRIGSRGRFQGFKAEKTGLHARFRGLWTSGANLVLIHASLNWCFAETVFSTRIHLHRIGGCGRISHPQPPIRCRQTQFFCTGVHSARKLAARLRHAVAYPRKDKARKARALS